MLTKTKSCAKFTVRYKYLYAIFPLSPKKIIMKRLLLALLIFGFPILTMGQSRSKDAVYFKNLTLQKNVSPEIKTASLGISRNFNGFVLDSLIYFTQTFEKAVLSGKSAGAVKPSLVKSALKKYPGTTKQALNSRLKLYATEPR